MATSRRFGQSFGPERRGGPGIIGIRFDAKPLINYINKLTGSFEKQPFRDALVRANEKAAIVVQQGMVNELNANIGSSPKYGLRPQIPGKRLQVALNNDKNREVYVNTFTVGLASWLDASPARRYWRQIELGNPQQYLRKAYFTTDFETFYHPWSQGGVSRGNRHKDASKTDDMPDGYPHARMPLTSRGPQFMVGPWDPLEFSAGGRRAFAKVDMRDLYTVELRRAGIPITKDTFR
jgi:hypothetical protein